MATIAGAFGTRDMAARAVDRLIAGGFDPGDVSVLGREGELADVTPENETARNVAVGAGVGAALGGLLVGAAAIAIPGIGPVLALGPFAALLPGAIAGGLIGFLVSRGVPEGEASFYAERVQAGAYLVAVEAEPHEETQARQILSAAGAERPIQG